MLLDLLFPRRCLACGRLGAYICTACTADIATAQPICPVCTRPAIDGSTHPRCRRPHALDGLTAAFAYRGVMRAAIAKIKYRWVSDIAEDLIAQMPPLPQSASITTDDIVVPVPLHPARKRWRGFNQSELLGQLLAKRDNLAYNPLLRRTRNTEPQTTFRRTQRIQNLRSAFDLADNAMKPPRRIILLDDVWTTGSTMHECAKVLKRNGTDWVWGVTIAR